MVPIVLRLIDVLFTAYSLAIAVRALLPWLGIGYHTPVMRILLQVTEPLLAPLRRVVPAGGGLDFTPLVALVLLWLAERILTVIVVAVL